MIFVLKKVMWNMVLGGPQKSKNVEKHVFSVFISRLVEFYENIFICSFIARSIDLNELYRSMCFLVLLDTSRVPLQGSQNDHFLVFFDRRPRDTE